MGQNEPEEPSLSTEVERLRKRALGEIVQAREQVDQHEEQLKASRLELQAAVVAASFLNIDRAVVANAAGVSESTILSWAPTGRRKAKAAL